MAIAPYDQVKAVLKYATSVIAPTKILMGMSLYGYDWTIPWQKGRLASGISNNSAQNLAQERQVPISWDSASGSPYFRYESAGQQHEVWFDDALSVAAKLNLVYEFGLRGVSYWVLGNSFPQNWHLIRESFGVKKP
jgi:cortical fragment-lytic enzyme